MLIRGLPAEAATWAQDAARSNGNGQVEEQVLSLSEFGRWVGEKKRGGG